MLIVTLRGEHVFHECSLFCTIDNTTDATLNKIKEEIKSKYGLEVYDFTKQCGTLNAWTSNDKVKVFIEEVFPL